MNLFFKIWTISLIIKLAIGYVLPLSFDESYYWVWGHHLQLSYFDHPPFVSWLYLLGQAFEGFGQAVRWPGILLGHCTLLLWYKILQPVLDNRRIVYWLLLALLTPLFGVGSLIITPDVPLMFFWSLSLLALIRCKEHESLGSYFFLGLAMGLGFCAKYHIVVLAPLGIIWLVKTRKFSKRTLGLIAWSLIWFSVGSMPVLYWNYKNEFISFLFQLGHGLGESHWSPMWPTKYFFDQLLILFPIVAYFCLQKKTSSWAPFFKIMGWGPLVFFFLATFKADSEANWPIAGYPALLALALLDNNKTWWVKTMVTIWATLFLIVISEALFGWAPKDKISLKTSEFTVFNPVMKTIKENPEIEPVYAYSFQMASKISYEMKQPIYKLKDLNRKDFYDFIPQSKPTKLPFYVAMENNTKLPNWVHKEGLQIVRTYFVNDRFRIVMVNRP